VIPVSSQFGRVSTQATNDPRTRAAAPLSRVSVAGAMGSRLPRRSIGALGIVGPTLELSCEAPLWPGIVSFISLLGGVVITSRAPARSNDRPRCSPPG
jgi:hypothetical protein